jgi:hypothetical protein
MRTRSIDLRPGQEGWWLVTLLAAELVAVGAYFLLTPAAITDPRYVAYPLLWIAAGVWGVARVEAPSASERARWGAGLLAAGYVLLLAFLTGLVAVYLSTPGGGHSHSHVHGLSVTMTSPGWGPRIGYVTHLFHVYFVPFRWIGYLALGYLLYTAVLDTATAALSGVFGVATCLSCALPVAASLAGGLGGAALAGAVTTYSLDISTAAFLLTVGLLALRPGATGRSATAS